MNTLNKYLKMNNLIDVIILSYTKTNKEYMMTTNCINSIKNNNIKTNIILIETESKFKNEKIYDVNTIIYPGVNFNYNKFINIGLKQSKNEYVLVTNNDIIYTDNCLSILKQKLDEKYDSVSPLDLITNKIIKNTGDQEGYDVGKIVTGWSIMFKKNILKQIGDFDERFSFWYQDNDYSNWLKKCNLKHALITNAHIYHLCSQSHRLLENNELYEKTHGLTKIFEEKWKDWNKVEPFNIQ